ncbi:hypothetical protein [Haloplanus rubicundus]|uniref:Uncharacterized protein n=1 Tax=Haloplanus rubicundus TaxID=1547898 RepID=A0A345EBA3_9EURY|nr:hypothetical protein [Haloplanus rubicundus]AXG09475.1 hypothetical protein DU484_06115 [Haloplanus rubicundus]
MTLLDNIDATEVLALVSLAGAAVAYVSGDSSDVDLSLPADFGQPSIPEDSVDTSDPDGGDTSDDWVGDVGDSAPNPDSGGWTDVPEDSVGVTDPDGGEPDDGWLGDVGDSAPETDDDPPLDAGGDWSGWGW